MGERVLELGNRELEKIGEYVKRNLNKWVSGSNIIPYRSDREMELLERMVRVEEGLKNLSEQVQKGFEYMERRFELVEKRLDQIDKRFEQVDKRFESFEARFNRITAVITVGFVMLTTLITVFKFVG